MKAFSAILWPALIILFALGQVIRFSPTLFFEANQGADATARLTSIRWTEADYNTSHDHDQNVFNPPINDTNIVYEEVATHSSNYNDIDYTASQNDFSPNLDETNKGLLRSETSEEVKSAVRDPACQLSVNISNSDYEFYRAVHESPFPACAAGTWTYRPDLVVPVSEEHLMCLDRERQGNCHDPNSWINSSDTAKLSRHNLILKNAVRNSPGILNASDPWIWQSDWEQYKLVPYHKHNQDDYRERIRKLLHGRSIYFVGDSLTRQWQHSMRCEIVHILGLSDRKAAKTVRYLQMHVGFKQGAIKRYGFPFQRATERDYVVFNFGHHTGKKLGPDWPPKYTKILTEALSWDFGKIPDHHVFFRTTTIRHFLAGKGDWNTNSSQAGATEPNMHDVWSAYGGESPELPLENLLAFDTLLLGDNNNTNATSTTNNNSNNMKGLIRNKKSSKKFRILDTSPMMLARADACFDGSHFCLPGPMDSWSRMLYYQMEQDEMRLESSWQDEITPGTEVSRLPNSSQVQ